VEGEKTRVVVEVKGREEAAGEGIDAKCRVLGCGEKQVMVSVETRIPLFVLAYRWRWSRKEHEVVQSDSSTRALVAQAVLRRNPKAGFIW
jgi:hypothetical protein